MTKVKNMFTETLMDCPADRISRGKISDGTSHPRGPQDQTMTMAVPLSTFPTPLIPNTFHISVPTNICHGKTRSSSQLAAAGAVGVVDGDEGGEDVDEAGDDGGDEGGVVAETDGLEEDGGVEHDDVDAGELLEEGMRTAMVSWGRYFLCTMLAQGCCTDRDWTLATTRSWYSASISVVPRTLRSMSRASSSLPRSMSELGVSGRKRDPTVMISAGTAAPARLMRHPHPPLIFEVP
ncbi:unnamed protein product [Spirodela intermedia]|uniref:Uncharacterized protein n=1 Tax=Spirodela intermedia TaxID=51605 RepID=A0A7I8ILV6_SPIIN|nr:unnamed protein product [Spirodela intermedia]CAA6658407.1 unnamed protein product [Spirodela intermedia]